MQAYTSSIRDLFVNFDIHVLNFSLPEPASILINVQALTLSYGIYIVPVQISLFIQYWRNDIRSILNNLQYHLCDKLNPSLYLSLSPSVQDLIQITDLSDLLLSESRNNSIYTVFSGERRNNKENYQGGYCLTERINTNYLYFEILTSKEIDITTIQRAEDHSCFMDEFDGRVLIYLIIFKLMYLVFKYDI